MEQSVSNFNVGDRVKIIPPNNDHTGEIGTVVRCYHGSCDVFLHKAKLTLGFWNETLQLVKDGEEYKQTVENDAVVGELTVLDYIRTECDNLKTFLTEKNLKYHNSALKPIRVFSKSSAEEQILVRCDDKINRIINTDVDDEDSLLDLIGYLLLLRINRKMNKSK